MVSLIDPLRPFTRLEFNVSLRPYTTRHKKAITSLAFHPSGWQLCSGSADCDARVWDLVGRWSAGAYTRSHFRST